MSYFKEIGLDTEGERGILYLTDDSQIACELQEAGEAVLVFLHPGNQNQDFSRVLFAVEDPEDLEPTLFRSAVISLITVRALSI